MLRELPRPALAGLVLLIAIRTAGALLLAQALADGIARIAGGHPAEPASLAIGCAGVVVQAVAAWAVRVVAARTAVAVKSRLRAEAAGRLVGGAGIPPARAALVAGSGLDDVDDLLGTAVPAAIAAVVVPLMVLARVLVADPLSGLIVALTLPLVPVFLALVGLHTRERTAAALAELARLAHQVVELAAGLPVLVGLGRITEQTAALSGVQDRVRRRTRETLRTAFLSSLALELVATISVAVVAVVLGVRLGAHDVPLSVALLVLVVAPDAFTALRDAGAAYHASQKGTEALAAVRALPVLSPAPVDPDAGVTLWNARARRDGRLVVGPLDLDVRPGELVALAGPSGCGKTTLLATLAGIPDADVTLTGIVARAPRLGYAPQEVRTLAADVASELALVAPDEAAARRVAVELSIDGLLGAAIADLSPGERRRVGVARALLHVDAGARLLLLDEPTAHLDADAAELVLAALRARRSRTAILVVTHDPALQAAADRVVTIAPGRVEERPQGDASRDLPEAPSTAPAPRVTTTAEASRSPVTQLLAAAPLRWTLAVVLGLLATIAALALTALSGWLIVRAASGAPILLLLPAIVGVRFFGLGRAVARYAERLQTHDALFAATDRMRLRIWRAIAARAAGSRRLQEGGTALDHLVTGIETVREAAPRVLVPLTTGVLAVLGAAATIGILAPAALPAAAALALAVVLVPLASAVGAARAEAMRARSRSALTREAAALADAGPVLAANGARAAVLRRLARLDAPAAAAERRGAIGLGGGEALARLAAGSAALLVAGAAGSSATAPLMAAAALLALAAADPLGGLAAAAPRIAGLRGALRALSPFLAPRPVVPEPARRAVRELRLDRLAVRWPDAPEPVVRDLDAHVAPGEWLVVRGPSGSGKSTLLTALLGGLPADSGRILIDGAPLEGTRPLFAWCPQDAHVFDSTLRGNLLLAGPATDAELTDALERVGLGSLLQHAPDGLDTRVGSTGRALSGGERRRLAVARALLTGSDVLLLDEPTAHLDEPGADALIDDLRNATRERIVVLVTHRDRDVREGDRVLDLGRGRTASASPSSTGDLPPLADTGSRRAADRVDNGAWPRTTATR